VSLPSASLPPGHPTPSPGGIRAYCTTQMLQRRSGEHGRVAEVFVRAAWRSTYKIQKTGVMPRGPRFLLFHMNADLGGLGGRFAMPSSFSRYEEEQVFLGFRPHVRAAVRSRAGTRLRSFALPRRVKVSLHFLPAFLQLSSRTVWTSVHHVIREPSQESVRRTHNARPAQIKHAARPSAQGRG
jgi:hypothetical protein